MIVVDTNILIYAALPGAGSGLREQLLQRDFEWAAPFLWRSEFRNVVAGYLRRRELSRAEAAKALVIAGDFLTAGEYDVEDANVLDLIENSRCTSYDCEFVALAKSLQVPLITEDRAVLRSFPQYCRSAREFLGLR